MPEYDSSYGGWTESESATHHGEPEKPISLAVKVVRIVIYVILGAIGACMAIVLGVLIWLMCQPHFWYR